MQSATRWRTLLVCIATAVVIAGLAYQNWRTRQPNQIRDSDQVVRDFATTASAEVRTYRQALRTLTADLPHTPDAVAVARSAIEARTHEAMAQVDTQAKAASVRIANMPHINARTERNRLARLEQRRRETHQLIAEIAAETQAALAAQETH